MCNDPAALYQAIKTSEKVLFFTGAGISTLSGIPDFRGNHGVYRKKWHGMEVEEILSLPCFLKHPEYFYEWAQTFVYGLENYRPNIVHKVIANWEKRQLIYRTYTQNIDILHQHAGSSLTVNPAAMLPQYTLRGGGKLAIINNQPTALDSYAAWKFNDLQKTFEALAAMN